MFSCSRWRYTVKVLSASLTENLPLTAASNSRAARTATLSFQLHRSSVSEPFGVACVFGVSGQASELCFLRSMNPDLVSSSSVLSSVFHHGSPASHDALCVLSMNGEVNPDRDTVRTVMRSTRDLVLQCVVSDVLTPKSKNRKSANENVEASSDEAVDDAVEAAAAPKVLKKRGRKPKAAAAPLQNTEEAGEDANSDADVAPKRRGRPAKTETKRRSPKHSRNQGAREPPKAAKNVEAFDKDDVEADSREDAIDRAVAAAAELTENVMEALDAIPEKPSKSSKPKRHRRTKAEMMAARKLAATTAAKQKSAVDGEADDVDKAASRAEEEEEEEAWFRKNKKLAKKTKSTEAETSAKKRGRRRSARVEKAADADNAAAEPNEEEVAEDEPVVKAKRGRKLKAAVKSARKGKQRKSNAVREDAEDMDDAEDAEEPKSNNNEEDQEKVEEEDITL